MATIYYKTGCLILAYSGIITKSVMIMCVSGDPYQAFNQHIIPYLVITATLLIQVAYETSSIDYKLEHTGVQLSGEEKTEALGAFMFVRKCYLALTYVDYALFLAFSSLLAVGTHKKKQWPLKSYLAFGLLHTLLMLSTTSVEYFASDRLATTLRAAAAVVFCCCLYGVKLSVDEMESNATLK